MTNVRMRRFLLLVGFLCLSAVADAAVMGWKDATSGLWVDWIDKNTKDAVKVIQAQDNESYSGAYTIPSTITVNMSNDPEVEDNRDFPVTKIVERAFQNAKNLTDVIIKANIEYIEYETFRYSGLKSIVLPSSVKSIALSAFADTPLTSINIPENVNTISNNAFGNCNQLQSVTFANVQALCNITFWNTNSNPLYYAKQLFFADAPTTPVTDLTIPGEVKTIKKYAFYHFESLTSLTLEEGVESIEESAFAYCANLESVSIPSTMTDIASNAFYFFDSNSTKLSEARFASEESLCNINYANIYANPLNYAHNLYIGNSTERAKVVTIREASLENGNRVRPYILAGAQNLDKVTLPKAATVIGTSAFSGCTGLKYAEYADQDQLLDMEYENTEANPLNYAKELLINGSYPTSITFTKNVKPRALINAQWLEVVDIQEGVTSIGAGAFMNCKKLAIVSLPPTLTSIGDDAFNGCEIMQAPSLPNGLLSIGKNAFFNCKGKSFTKISIPANCLIGTGAFKLCSELITVSQMPANMTTIPDNSFENCYKLKNITIPNTVTTIGNSAFRNCVALTNIPYGETSAITEIGENAFFGCTGFTEVEIKNPVSTIKNYAFKGCSNITTVNLPSTIHDIRLGVFSNCTKLANVIVNSDEAPMVGTDAFDGKQAEMKLYVKESAKSSFAGADIWKEFNGGDIETSGDYKLTFHVNDKVDKVIELPVGTTIPEANRNYEPAKQTEDVFSGWDKEIPLTMPSENIDVYGYVSMKREIAGTDGEYAYKYKYHLQPAENIPGQESKPKRATLIAVTLLDENYHNIKIPAEVTYENVTYPVIAIGDSAFFSYDKKSQIQKVSMPASKCITEVGKVAFKGCNNLGEVENFDGVTIINESVFQNCSTLQTITLSDVTKIGRLAFSGCSSLDLEKLPENLETISYQAFANTGIENVTVAKNTELEDEVFKGCTKLETVDFEDDYNAPLPKLFFWNCTALKNVTLRGTMGSIHEGAFKGCTSLAAITIPNGITQLGNDVFMGCTSLTKVILPSSELTTISQSAFSGCTALSAITLPASIDNIRQKAFTGCTSLEGITVQRTNPPTLIENAFDDNTYKNAKLYVNAGNVNNYKGQSPWSKFGDNILSIGNFTLTYIVDGNTETPHKTITDIPVGTYIAPLDSAVNVGHKFSGWLNEPESMPDHDVVVTGKFKYQLSFSYSNDSEVSKDTEEFSLPKPKWYFYGDDINKEAFEDSLHLAKYHYTLASDIPITMPAKDSVITVEYELAEQTASYEHLNTTLNYKVYLLDSIAEVIASPDVAGNITIPDSISYNEKKYPVRAIQDGAFEGNQKITKMDIKADITSIGSRAFFDNRFTSFTIPTNVERIGADAFLCCSSMATLTFNDKIEELPSGVFRNCLALSDVNLPSSVTKIGKQAFAGCSKLELLTINNTTMPNAEASTFDQNQYAYTKLRVPVGVDVDNLPAPWFNFVDRAEQGGESTTNKCATPEIVYDKGKLKFSCSTADAEIVSWVDVDDVQQRVGNEWTLVRIYTIHAYARKTSWIKSDEPQNVTITWRNGTPTFGTGFKSVTLEESNPKRGDVNEDGKVDAQDASVVLQYVAKKITW